MGTTQAFAKETERLTGLATAIDRAPESRINAARALLRHTRFADRSLRIAKKLARDFMDNEEVSAFVRAKARNLFTYLTEKIVDENEAPAVVIPLDGVISPAPLVSPKRSVIERNVGWNALPVPRKFINYDSPEDLPQFGIPALSAFAITRDRGDWDGEIRANDGTLYYTQFCGGMTARVLNPKYIPAYRLWKAKRFPTGLPDEFSDWYIRWLSFSDIQARPAWAERINQSWAVGSALRDQQHASGEVEPWEETFARELFFEIALRNRSNPRPFGCVPWDIFHYHSQPATPETVSPQLAATEI